MLRVNGGAVGTPRPTAPAGAVLYRADFQSDVSPNCIRRGVRPSLPGHGALAQIPSRRLRAAVADRSLLDLESSGAPDSEAVRRVRRIHQQPDPGDDTDTRGSLRRRHRAVRGVSGGQYEFQQVHLVQGGVRRADDRDGLAAIHSERGHVVRGGGQRLAARIQLPLCGGLAARTFDEHSLATAGGLWNGALQVRAEYRASSRAPHFQKRPARSDGPQFRGKPMMRSSRALWTRASVLECGGPPPLLVTYLINHSREFNRAQPFGQIEAHRENFTRPMPRAALERQRFRHLGVGNWWLV